MVIVPRIAAVSYLNTIPFIYGIGHEGNLRAELLLSPPAVCAKNFAEHKADIALVPAAAVPSLADAEIVTEYCIGAAGPVRTVVLLSGEPIETVRRVFLDAHSLTSVQLAGYLVGQTLEGLSRILYVGGLRAAGPRPAGRRLPADRRQGFRLRGPLRLFVRSGRRVEKSHASALRLRRLDRPQGCRSRSDRRVGSMR